MKEASACIYQNNLLERAKRTESEEHQNFIHFPLNCYNPNNSTPSSYLSVITPTKLFYTKITLLFLYQNYFLNYNFSIGMNIYVFITLLIRNKF